MDINKGEGKITNNKIALADVPLADEKGDLVGRAYVFESEGNFVLTWTDFVANEWSETFRLLGHAMARLSVLHYAVGAGAFLKETPHDFASNADDFLRTQIEVTN
jgi:hypothetical protein